jgi:hypothetical protein
MDREQVILQLMREKKLKNYLEIGVFNGHIFFRVKSSFKVAVDPFFRFSTGRKILKTILNPANINNQYFQKTADDFFTQDAARVIGNRKLEISLIDGMHEYEYALRDAENVLKYLSGNGVIVMHDCNPLTRAANVSFAEWEARNFEGTWNGDVWKTIMHLRTRPDLNVFVLDCDHGLGVITRSKPESVLNYTPQQIAAFTYEDFNKNRNAWLNLKPADYYYEYFGLKP